MLLLKLYIIAYFFAGFAAASRFKGHKYFYYIFAIAAAEPLMYILRKFVSFDNSVYFSIVALLILFAVPKLDYKKRIVTVLALIITISHYNYNPLIFLIIGESILLIIFFALLDDFYTEYNSFGEGSIFLLLFSLDTLISSINLYLAIENILVLMSIYYWLISLNIIVYVLIAIVGPQPKLNLSILKHYRNTFFNFSQIISNVAGHILIHYPQKIENGNQIFRAETEMANSDLTRREFQVLSFLSQGLSNQEIANNMCVDKRTVSNHLQHIKEKLGYENMHELRKSARNHL